MASGSGDGDADINAVVIRAAVAGHALDGHAIHLEVILPGSVPVDAHIPVPLPKEVALLTGPLVPDERPMICV